MIVLMMPVEAMGLFARRGEDSARSELLRTSHRRGGTKIPAPREWTTDSWLPHPGIPGSSHRESRHQVGAALLLMPLIVVIDLASRRVVRRLIESVIAAAAGLSIGHDVLMVLCTWTSALIVSAFGTGGVSGVELEILTLLIAVAAMFTAAARLSLGAGIFSPSAGTNRR